MEPYFTQLVITSWGVRPGGRGPASPGKPGGTLILRAGLRGTWPSFFAHLVNGPHGHIRPSEAPTRAGQREGVRPVPLTASHSRRQGSVNSQRVCDMRVTGVCLNYRSVKASKAVTRAHALLKSSRWRRPTIPVVVTDVYLPDPLF